MLKKHNNNFDDIDENGHIKIEIGDDYLLIKCDFNNEISYDQMVMLISSCN